MDIPFFSAFFLIFMARCSSSSDMELVLLLNSDLSCLSALGISYEEFLQVRFAPSLFAVALGILSSERPSSSLSSS